MDARPVLGLRALRPSLLDDISAAEAGLSAGRHAETRDRTRPVTDPVVVQAAMRSYVLDDDEEDEDDEVRDSDEDDEDGEDDEDEDAEETWQCKKRCPSTTVRLTKDGYSGWVPIGL